MIAWIAAGVAVFYSLWSVALAVLFATRLRIPENGGPARVVLVLPATGALPGLEDLLTALSTQTLKPQRMIVAVEAADDPAFARVAALTERFSRLNIQLGVAGVSSLRGKKCTKLLAALARLYADDAHVVLLDADIRPQPWWLAAMVGPLAAGRADIVNGYRWPVPTKLSLASALIAGIDRPVAVLPRLPQTRALWGGSLALTRRALETLDLPATIARTLTEDLPIGEHAAQTGLRVLTRRAIRPATPIDGSLSDLWRFARRQYQLIRLYRRGLWWLAAIVVSTDVVARTALLAAVTASAAALPAIVVIAALGSAAVEVRLAISKKLGVRDGIGFRAAQHLLAWAILPTPLFHASVVWGGSVTSPVVWRHVRYLVDRTGQVIGVDHRPYALD